MPEHWLTPPGNREIEALRPARNHVNADIPYHFLHEQEPGPRGIETVNTIFLTGKECSFKCLMCDLWKNTLPGPTPPGAIVRQLDHALAQLPPADTIKLYNNGNFFDPKAVPVSDHPAILERVHSYGRVVVENHPRLVGDACLRFRDGLSGTLEVAMGLETIHPFALPALNKQLTPDDFRRAATFLKSNGIRVRAFVLLNPPYLIPRTSDRGETQPEPHLKSRGSYPMMPADPYLMSHGADPVTPADPRTVAREGIRWAVETVRFAFECGVDCCSIIATRPGNGVMEALQTAGYYVPPTLGALEEVFAEALALARGRLVFVDTWDIGFLSSCPHCFAGRKERLEKMNLFQTNLQPMACSCHSEYG